MPNLQQTMQSYLPWALVSASTVALTSLAACSSSSGSYQSRPKTTLSLDQPSRLTPPQPGRSAYKIGAPYKIGTQWYVPREQPGYDAVGVASWYGPNFDGKPTANGEIYDRHALTAAHPTLPLPSLVRVQNMSNGRSIVVRVNDRGPFVSGRIIDLSFAAANELGFAWRGVSQVRVIYIGRAAIQSGPS